MQCTSRSAAVLLVETDAEEHARNHLYQEYHIVMLFTCSCDTLTSTSSSNSSSGKYISCAKHPVVTCASVHSHTLTCSSMKKITPLPYDSLGSHSKSLCCVQSLAGKFMLNGEEIDLGVGPQASMAHRVEALRVLLEQRLGFDTFMK